jgi:hypothetical protein
LTGFLKDLCCGFRLFVEDSEASLFLCNSSVWVETCWVMCLAFSSVSGDTSKDGTQSIQGVCFDHNGAESEELKVIFFTTLCAHEVVTLKLEGATLSVYGGRPSLTTGSEQMGYTLPWLLMEDTSVEFPSGPFDLAYVVGNDHGVDFGDENITHVIIQALELAGKK